MVRRAVVIGIVVLALAACSTPVGQPSTTPSTLSEATTTSTTTDFRSSGTLPPYLPADLLEAIPASGKHVEFMIDAMTMAADYPYTEASWAFLKDVFADGEVIRSEYERAVFAAADCMRQFGYQVEGPFPGTTAVIVGVDPGLYMDWWTVNAPSSVDDDFNYCQGLWEFTVAHVWLVSNEPTESERQRWLDAAWECARNMGLTMSEPPTQQNAIDAVTLGCEPWDESGAG